MGIRTLSDSSSHFPQLNEESLDQIRNSLYVPVRLLNSYLSDHPVEFFTEKQFGRALGGGIHYMRRYINYAKIEGNNRDFFRTIATRLVHPIANNMTLQKLAERVGPRCVRVLTLHMNAYDPTVPCVPLKQASTLVERVKRKALPDPISSSVTVVNLEDKRLLMLLDTETCHRIRAVFKPIVTLLQTHFSCPANHANIKESFARSVGQSLHKFRELNIQDEGLNLLPTIASCLPLDPLDPLGQSKTLRELAAAVGDKCTQALNRSLKSYINRHQEIFAPRQDFPQFGPVVDSRFGLEADLPPFFPLEDESCDVEDLKPSPLFF